MKKLTLKSECKGLIITRNHFSLGRITFNADQVDPANYINYSKSGFENIFIEVCADCNAAECVCGETLTVIETLPEERKTLTLEDSIADLNGTPRPTPKKKRTKK